MVHIRHVLLGYNRAPRLRLPSPARRYPFLDPMALTETEIQRQKEIQQAEELLFSRRPGAWLRQRTFPGRLRGRLGHALSAPDRRATSRRRSRRRGSAALSRRTPRPEEIDREADIPRHVIDGLGRVGVLGMTAPKEFGGRGFSQMAVLQGAGGNRRTLRFDLGFHECASLDRDSRAAAFRNARAERKMAAARW